MNRRTFIAALAASSASPAFAQAAPSPAAPLIYYAGQAGRLTSDRSSQGGNPFASALCEVIGERPLSIEKFTKRMAEANQIHSRGWQMMDYPRVLPDPKRRLDKGETRLALQRELERHHVAVHADVVAELPAPSAVSKLH